MSITDELRKYISGTARCGISPICEKSLANIADRIDAEHESACAEAYGNGVMSVPVALDESAWVELPKDADGEYIHIGDVLTDDAEFKSEGKVMRLMLEDEGWMVGLGCAGGTEPSIHEWHHYHAPTVEDVLTEFGIDWEHESDCEDRAALLKEYATKLQLKEDA